jgi:hypothetical protein
MNLEWSTFAIQNIKDEDSVEYVLILIDNTVQYGKILSRTSKWTKKTAMMEPNIYVEKIKM